MHYAYAVKCGKCAYLSANEQVRDIGCIFLEFRDPFLSYILEAGWIHHREANEEDIGHRVGQGS